MLARAMRHTFALATRRLPVLGVRDFRLLLADRVLAPMSFALSVEMVARTEDSVRSQRAAKAAYF